MPLPTEPVTLSLEQIGELNLKLSGLRHDVNGQLANVVAAAELIRRRPENAERLLNTLVEQPQKIAEAIAQFSAGMEAALGITRP